MSQDCGIDGNDPSSSGTRKLLLFIMRIINKTESKSVSKVRT
jgi:hypothetical protein